MQPAKTVNNLLEQACPSIQYRLRREVLGESRSAPHMLDLQGQILEDEAVKEVIGWQQADGWLAWDFHGYTSTESGIRLLCEKGVDPRHPVLSDALRALERETGRLERGGGKVGHILDDTGLGGSQMIRAALFAQAGPEDKPFVKAQIDEALAGFRAVLGIDTIGDLVEEYRGKLVFRQNARWPSIYHLRLLALTRDWRTPQYHQEIAECVQRLVKLSPVPDIYVRYKSQLIAPASFCMDNFGPDVAALDEAHWMMWFHRMELLSRLGVVGCIPELAGQIAALVEILDAGEGRFTRSMSHDYFKKWGAYTGLMLERDWRASQRRVFDLTFRSLLILHYSAIYR